MPDQPTASPGTHSLGPQEPPPRRLAATCPIMTKPPGSQRSVLIIDDDLAITAQLTHLLRREDLLVATAATGPLGVHCARELGPDLILLDVELPGLDGFQICQIIKSDPRTRWIPVIMLTGLRDVRDRIQGINAGADDFLSKPFVGGELLARIRALLRMKVLVDQLEHAESVITSLALAVEARDPYTEGHCDRLATLATALGRTLGLPDSDLAALRLGGILHDIGKIAIPDAILLKPGPLTDEEWVRMRRHPVQGEEICRPIRSLKAVLPIIRHHHERRDGSGYPDGLAGDAIPLTARVLQVVDVFDALTTERPYKRALSPDRALDILRTEADRGWWDPGIVAAFCTVAAREHAALGCGRSPGPPSRRTREIGISESGNPLSPPDVPCSREPLALSFPREFPHRPDRPPGAPWRNHR